MFSKKIVSCSMALLLTACSVNKVEYPDHIKEVLPVQTPVRAITGFTPGLQCMDQMFLQYKVKPIRVTAAPLPDYSESRGDASYGAREMLISAISSMSQHSGAIRFIAYDRSTPDIIALQSAHPRKQEFMVPDFFIRGAVTQIDSSPYSKQNGYSLSANDIDYKEVQGGSISNSNSASLKSVAVDLNMGLVNNFEVLPGILSSNSFTVEKRGDSDDYALNIWKLGSVYSINENRAEVLSSGLRALMEVGAIELFGKLYNLPYWECLGVLGADTEMEAKAAKDYASKTPAGRIQWIGDELVRQEYLKEGTAYTREDGGISDAFRRALSHYRIKHDLFGNSLVTEE
ncbi:MAG: hypothetical protein ACPG80_01965, partial [Rickettsiales bacterium]